MTSEELRILSQEYIFESDFYNSIEEFIKEKNIDDVKKFKFFYKVEYNKQDKTEKIKILDPLFSNNTAIEFVNTKITDKKIIFHPCTVKGYKYQLSYFDQYGAIMDEKSNTIKETIDNYIRNYNDYKIAEVIA